MKIYILQFLTAFVCSEPHSPYQFWKSDRSGYGTQDGVANRGYVRGNRNYDYNNYYAKPEQANAYYPDSYYNPVDRYTDSYEENSYSYGYDYNRQPKAPIHSIISFLRQAVEKAKRRYFPQIDRQFPGGIPPVLAFVGAATTVAAGGVLEQTGVLGAIRDAISEIIDPTTTTSTYAPTTTTTTAAPEVPCVPTCEDGYTCNSGTCECGGSDACEGSGFACEADTCMCGAEGALVACDASKGFACEAETCTCGGAECEGSGATSDTCVDTDADDVGDSCQCGDTGAVCADGFTCTAGACVCGDAACDATANLCVADLCMCGAGDACTAGNREAVCLLPDGTVDTAGLDIAICQCTESASCVGTPDADVTESLCGLMTNSATPGKCQGCLMATDGTGGDGAASGDPATGDDSTCDTGGCCAGGECVTVGENCP